MGVFVTRRGPSDNGPFNGTLSFTDGSNPQNTNIGFANSSSAPSRRTRVQRATLRAACSSTRSSMRRTTVAETDPDGGCGRAVLLPHADDEPG
jgi:hypothetical protein